MARATRVALDLALVSVIKIRPTVSKIWGAAKALVINTPAKPLVCNIVVDKVEVTLDKLADLIQSTITHLRNKQLPREEKYLEKELDKVRQRMSADGRGDSGRPNSTSKAVRPVLGTAWQYAKTEIAPPMTLGFFHGPSGKALENAVAKSVDGFITGLDSKIKEIDASALKEKQEKEAAIIAAQEKVKAEAKAKELERKRADEAKRVAAEKEAKAKAQAKPKEEPKKTDKKVDKTKEEKKKEKGKSKK